MSLTVIVLGLQAQEQHCWEQYLNQVMNAEDMASEQWQENYDLLCELEQNPININKTTREELEQIPFLSTQQVEALEEYLYRYGSMKSLKVTGMAIWATGIAIGSAIRWSVAII